jgi:O-glycosyl hydrolase
MKLIHNRLFLTLFHLVITSGLFACCSKTDSPQNEPAAKDSILIIDTNIKYQTIHNFGASDAWTGQYVGLWPDSKRNQIADWLFSNENESNGQPRGIGLSLWRFNIGAGSAAQNNIGDEWRATETFLNNDGTYNWTKQAGQRWLMNAAKERGVSQFLGFTNSPPVNITKNGKAFSSLNNQANIEPKNYLAFARFLVDVSEHFRQQAGISFNYLSPFNEPQWDWTGNGQEGTPYTNQEIYDITRNLDSLITSKQLPYKILIGEAGKLNYLYEDGDKPSRGNQISDFFNANSPRYLGEFNSVEKAISGHSYFTTAPASFMTTVRTSLKNKLKEASVPLEFWQSEYCILGDQEEIPGGGKDLGISTALYVARIIHHDLTISNASAWQWWLAVTAYDYKDGLIYVDKNQTDGNIEDSKLLWAVGNFSRFIRPGAIRVDVTGKNTDINDPVGLMVSSYLNTDNKLVTVFINYSNKDVNYNIQVKGMNVSAFTPYLTSSATNKGLNPLSRIKNNEKITIPKRSILTVVSE